MQKFLFPFVFLVTLASFPGIAQAQQAPPLDSRCFTQSECMAARAKMGAPISDQVQGFYNNTAETRQACEGKKDSTGGELGFCLPAGQAVTAVKFGGTTKFANIGVFIQYIYRYGIIFAGLLAVIIIIVSGLQWTASGGNSSTIESAKTRITGAVTGLVLAAASYIILNTLNPATVNLRLPQIWLIRQDRIQNEYKFCMAVPPKPLGGRGEFQIPKITPYTENYQAIPDGAFTEIYSLGQANNPYQQVFPPKTENNPGATCGQKMVIQNMDGASCMTTYCPNGQLCYEDEKKCKPFDAEGGIAGTITASDGKYLDDIWLKVICDDDGEYAIEDIDSVDIGDGVNFYKFNDVAQQGANACDGENKVVGYFFIVEVNDSDLLNTTDDQWMGGNSFCKINGPSCGFYGYNGSLNTGDAEPFIGPMVQSGELFLQGDLARGINCSFNNTLDAMPNIGNAYSTYLFYAGVNAISKDLGNFVQPGNEVSAEFGTLGGKCPALNAKQKQWDEYIEAHKKQ